MAIVDVLFGSLSRILSTVIGLSLIVGIIWFMVHLMKGSTRQSRREWKLFNRAEDAFKEEKKDTLKLEADVKRARKTEKEFRNHFFSLGGDLRKKILRLDEFLKKFPSSGQALQQKINKDYKKRAIKVFDKYFVDFMHELTRAQQTLNEELNQVKDSIKFSKQGQEYNEQQRKNITKDAATIKNMDDHKQASEKYALLQSNLRALQNKQAITSKLLSLQIKLENLLQTLIDELQSSREKGNAINNSYDKIKTVAQLRLAAFKTKDFFIEVGKRLYSLEERHATITKIYDEIELLTSESSSLERELETNYNTYQSIIVTQVRSRQIHANDNTDDLKKVA